MKNKNMVYILMISLHAFTLSRAKWLLNLTHCKLHSSIKNQHFSYHFIDSFTSSLCLFWCSIMASTTSSWPARNRWFVSFSYQKRRTHPRLKKQPSAYEEEEKKDENGELTAQRRPCKHHRSPIVLRWESQSSRYEEGGPGCTNPTTLACLRPGIHEHRYS